MWRWLLTAVLVAFSLLLWYMTLTVPMVSATAPAILAIMFSGITWLTWPTRRKKTEKAAKEDIKKTENMINQESLQKNLTQ